MSLVGFIPLERDPLPMSRTVVRPPTVGHEPPVWAPLLRALQEQLPARQVNELLGSLTLLDGDPNTLRVRVPFAKLNAWLQNGLLLRLEGLVSALSGGRCSLALVPTAETEATEGDPTQTLERFVTGPGNQLCLDAARAFIARAGSAPRPLLVSGPRDSGKTHLLRGIARALTDRPLEGPVLFRSAELLSLEIVRAIWNGELSDLRAVLCRAGALVIDNLHAVTDREATRRELTIVLEILHQRGAPVALSTDRPPGELRHLGKNLEGILRSATTVRLSRPEWETRVAIFLDRARAWGLDLRSDVASTLTTEIGEELSRIDPILTRCMLLRPPDLDGVELEHARRALAPGPLYAYRPAPELVLDVVARHYGLRMRDLKGSNRMEPLRTARRLASYLLRVRCGLSFPEIGRRLGRHHTTALNAVRQTQRHLGDDATLAGQLALIEKEIVSRAERVK